MIRGNFLGAAIVAIINLILLDTNSFGRQSRTSLIWINIVLDFLIIVLMHFAFRT